MAEQKSDKELLAVLLCFMIFVILQELFLSFGCFDVVCVHLQFTIECMAVILDFEILQGEVLDLSVQTGSSPCFCLILIRF